MDKKRRGVPRLFLCCGFQSLRDYIALSGLTILELQLTQGYAGLHPGLDAQRPYRAYDVVRTRTNMLIFGA